MPIRCFQKEFPLFTKFGILRPVIFKKFALKVQKSFLGFDSLANSPEEPRELESKLNPIFILGPPRSGTTLLLQELITHSDVVFFSNLMVFLPKLMLKIFLFTKGSLLKLSEVKEAEYGYVPGLNSPNEAGQVFRGWFKRKPSKEKVKLIKNTVNFISTRADCPLISKNLNNATRLKNIIELFPDMKIIYIKRDPLITAQSILSARRNLNEDAKWFGVKPPGYEKVLSKSLHYQVVWQVKQIEDIVEKFLATHDVNHYSVTYEDYCANSKTHVQNMIKQFGLKENPAEFVKWENRNEIKSSPEEWKMLKDSYRELYRQDYKKIP